MFELVGVLGQARSALACLDSFEQVADHFGFWLGPEIALTVFADRQVASFLFPLANEQDGVHFFSFRTANACPDFVGGRVHADAHHVIAKLAEYLFGIINLAFTEWEQANLIRG